MKTWKSKKEKILRLKSRKWKCKKKRKKKKKMVRKENFLQVDNFGVCFILKKKVLFSTRIQQRIGNNAESFGPLSKVNKSEEKLCENDYLVTHR